MSTTAAGRLYTVEEFEALSDTNGYELVDGQLVEKPSMGLESAQIITNLILLLGGFVKQHGVGYVSNPEGGFVLFPGQSNKVRKPDVSFVRKDRFPDGKIPRGYARFAPDFAFESVSPNDSADDVQEKVEEYLRAGVRLVWVAYPKSQVVLAFRPDRSVQRFTAADQLTAEDVFPGFTCRTAELFALD